jgi:ribosomal protein S18 acetylase RimI-like enzyme
MTGAEHPERARLVQVVHDWFHGPFHAMGYDTEPRRWGTYWNSGHVYTRGVPSDQVEAFLADIRAFYGDRSVSIYVDGHEVESVLGPALCAAGCTPAPSEIFLAHVGPVPSWPSASRLSVEAVHAANLRDFVTLRLRAFASLEAPPPDEAVREEIARRQAELGGTGRGWLARIRGEPAGIIWWYDDPQDIYVLLLGVRLPFRNQGVGRTLLCKLLAEAYARGCRSVLLSVLTENIDALRLYHRLGFRDEIHWRRRYLVRTRGRAEVHSEVA